MEFLLPLGKSKSQIEREVISGYFPPCVCYKILFTSPKEKRVRPALLEVDLQGANKHLTFSCIVREEEESSECAHACMSVRTRCAFFTIYFNQLCIPISTTEYY